jgi:hypothetical protein
MDEDCNPVVVAVEFAECMDAYYEASLACSYAIVSHPLHGQEVSLEMVGSISAAFKRLWEAIKRFFRAIKNWMFGYKTTTTKSYKALNKKAYNLKHFEKLTLEPLTDNDFGVFVHELFKLGAFYKFPPNLDRVADIPVERDISSFLLGDKPELTGEAIEFLKNYLGVDIFAVPKNDLVRYAVVTKPIEDLYPKVDMAEASGVCYRDYCTNGRLYYANVQALLKAFGDFSDIIIAVNKIHDDLDRTLREEKSILAGSEDLRTQTAILITNLKSRLDIAFAITNRYMVVMDTLIHNLELAIKYSAKIKELSVKKESSTLPA